MPNQTFAEEIKLQEILPPPIIFETSPSAHRGIKYEKSNKIKTEKVYNGKTSFCPHCGFSIES